MLPAHPPLPTPRNLPFQPSLGIQTSILMSESRVGVSVAATRQKAGSFAAAGGTLPLAVGGENWPAPTTTACVTATFDSFSAARLSHVAAVTGDGPARIAATVAAAPTTFKLRIARSPAGRRAPESRSSKSTDFKPYQPTT